jgi:hypothetical protein
MTDPWKRRCRGAALLALLLALPLSAKGVEPAEAAAAPPEAPVEFRPLPPIEFPKPPPRPPPPPPEPAPAEPPPTSEPEAAQPVEAPEAMAPAPRKPFVWPSEPTDRRWALCAILTVGLFGSDADAGLMADVGARIMPVTLRYSWRGTFLENGTSEFESLRASWNWGLWSAASESVSLAAYAGLGVGELSTSVEASYTEPSSSESASAAVVEGGLVLEWGALEILRLSVELVRSTEGMPPGAPSFLFGFSVSPIVLLGALK